MLIGGDVGVFGFCVVETTMHKSKTALPVTYALPHTEQEESWSHPPLSAGEYLARVRREADKIPDVMISTDSHSSSITPVINNHSFFDANEDWQDRTVAHFSLLAHSLSKLKQGMEDGEVPPVVRKGVPPLRAVESWHYFCFGNKPPNVFETHTISDAPQNIIDLENVGLDTNYIENEEMNLLLSTAEIGEEEDGEIDKMATNKKRSHKEIIAETLKPENEVRPYNSGEVIINEEKESVLKDVDNKGEQVVMIKSPEEWAGLGIHPSISLMAQLDGIATLRILSHHIHWLDEIHHYLNMILNNQEDTNKEKQICSDNLMIMDRCRWTYAVLSNLISPLHRDTESDITRLYQVCFSIYSLLTTKLDAIEGRIDKDEVEKSILPALCILMTVAAKYFHQAPKS